MKTYTATIACDVRAYATVEIEAETENDAARRAEEIALQLRLGQEPVELLNTTFSVEWDTASEYEYLGDAQ